MRYYTQKEVAALIDVREDARDPENVWFYIARDDDRAMVKIGVSQRPCWRVRYMRINGERTHFRLVAMMRRGVAFERVVKNILAPYRLHAKTWEYFWVVPPVNRFLGQLITLHKFPNLIT